MQCKLLELAPGSNNPASSHAGDNPLALKKHFRKSLLNDSMDYQGQYIWELTSDYFCFLLHGNVQSFLNYSSLWLKRLDIEGI